ncbi:hypothetical protein CAPTEDRAFT_202801 [Capitella teleta]|uniref:CARD domain-containing protein n=1 Tax=Capitella teleta TaxID=283909 RepID=R7UZ18_CAPTE|nr:hypothetical protein CAPTEDRAFT_202801 [Capitella teleta]|eukprot:ELU09187.1 hypothetical protein CAPTEDRAFT_202801 [Capitella teleta]
MGRAVLQLSRELRETSSQEVFEQEERVEFKMEDRHKECLKSNRDFLCSNISLSTGLLAKLSESGVITDEHLQKLQNIERNDTTKAAVLEFLTEVLPRRAPEAFNLFLEALSKSAQKHIADHLEKWLGDVCSEDAGTFERLRAELQSHYKRRLASIRPMPWQQDIYLNLTDFKVEGYDKEEQLKHVERYAAHQNIASAPFESMLNERSIRDLCSNPLNLTLLCLLREEDTQLRITRTALYTSIHRIIKEKAAKRLDLSPEKVEESLLRPLYRFAFEAHQKNETVVGKNDFKKVKNFQQVCEVGYLTRELSMSHLQPEVRFQFTHKTFVEFLTAKHIAEMDREERLNWMQHLRYANCYIWIGGLAIDDDFKVEQNEPILAFLFGLLEEESAELTEMASLVIKETHFSSEPLPMPLDSSSFPISLDSSCDASHQLLRLLAELNVVPPELADVICKGRPPLINIYDDCSASCMKGMLKLCNLRFQPPIPMNVHLGYSRDEEMMSFVQKLIKCKSIECSKIWIMPFDHTELWNDVRGLQIGQANSFQQVGINCYRIKGNRLFAALLRKIKRRRVSFGDHLSELELIWFKPSLSFLLKAALHKPLTSLQLIHCYKLDDRCISLIHQLLRNQRQSLQRVQLTSLSWQQQHFGRFLADFAQMENLQSLEITLIDSTDEEKRILEAILKRNKLSELTIYSSKYSRSLDSVLNEGFNSMSSLRELHLRFVNIIHLPNLRHLDLINFCLLRYSTLNDDGIAVLSDALRSWRNLQQLRIDFDRFSSVAECSLRKLFEAIAGCHRLQILHFNRLKMADSVVPSVCEMIESLKELREFTSEDQRDKSLTEEGFKQLEPILKRNGLNTDVRSE